MITIQDRFTYPNIKQSKAHNIIHRSCSVDISCKQSLTRKYRGARNNQAANKTPERVADVIVLFTCKSSGTVSEPSVSVRQCEEKGRNLVEVGVLHVKWRVFVSLFNLVLLLLLLFFFFCL